ncbi:unnamed protein product, partial [Heterosigma akashiwo]
YTIHPPENNVCLQGKGEPIGLIDSVRLFGEEKQHHIDWIGFATLEMDASWSSASGAGVHVPVAPVTDSLDAERHSFSLPRRRRTSSSSSKSSANGAPVTPTLSTPHKNWSSSMRKKISASMPRLSSSRTSFSLRSAGFMSLSMRSNSSLRSDNGGYSFPLALTNVSSHSIPGKKQKNEDRYYAITEGTLGSQSQAQVRSNEPLGAHLDLSKLSVFAVIDGHGGPGCADFVVNNMDRVVNQCQTFSKPAGENTPFLLEQGAREIIASLASDFLRYAQDKGDTSGACLVMAFCYETYVCVANVGDCLAAFVGATGKMKLPSRVHRCAVDNERNRIKNAGGYVDEQGRLMGCLLPSRSLGDLDVQLAHPG